MVYPCDNKTISQFVTSRIGTTTLWNQEVLLEFMPTYIVF